MVKVIRSCNKGDDRLTAHISSINGVEQSHGNREAAQFSPLPVGGQAVYEGVMMRSPNYMAVAVRRKDGTIAIHDEPVPKPPYLVKWAHVPFVRGWLALWETIASGLKAVRVSVELSEGEAPVTRPLGFALQIMAGIGLALVLFVLAPHGIANATRMMVFKTIASSASPPPLWVHVIANLWEGVLRVAVFIGFIALVGVLPEMKRFFAYHGAEHKAVHAYEYGKPLTVDAALPYPTLHPRCGTTFIFIVLIVSLLAFAFVPWTHWAIRFGGRIVLLPIVIGASYEVLRWGAHTQKRWLAVIANAGLTVQRLTTREPTLQQLEVGLHALRRVLQCEGVIVVDEPTMCDAKCEHC